MACGENFALPDLPLSPHHPSDRNNSDLEAIPPLVYCHICTTAFKIRGSSTEPSFMSSTADHVAYYGTVHH